MTTTKYMFDDSSHTVHRVEGYAHPWEELSPGIRVRRRVIRPPGPYEPSEPIAWFAASIDVEGDEPLESCS